MVQDQGKQKLPLGPRIAACKMDRSGLGISQQPMDPETSPSTFSRREALRTIVFSSSALFASGLSARAAGPPSADFGNDGLHFLAVGDFGSGKAGQVQVAQQMNAFAGKLGKPLTAVLALGDNFYDHLEPAR